MAYNNMRENAHTTGYSAENPAYGWKPGSPSSSDDPSVPPNVNFVDPETLEAKNFNFSEQSIRKGFIRKVYLILMAQLSVTFGFVAVFVFHKPAQEFAARSQGLFMLALLLTLIVVVSMACCESARRTFPTNFICLSIFTLAESFLVAVIASRFDPATVLMAVGITALLCLSLTAYAMQTKYDFTGCGGFLIVALMCVIIFGFVAAFWHNYIIRCAYASVGALLACVFLIYDTQLMMGGEHKYSISPEEYIFAALNLYMDVIRIFLYVLQLLGDRK